MKGPAAVVPQRAFLFARRARAVSPYKITRGRILYLVNAEAFGLSRRNPLNWPRIAARQQDRRVRIVYAQILGADASARRGRAECAKNIECVETLFGNLGFACALAGCCMEKGDGNGRREKFENFWRFEAGIDLLFLKRGKGKAGKNKGY